MSLINTKIKPFKNQAFKNVNSLKSPRKIPKAAGASSSSTRPILPLFARLNWVTLPTITKNCRSWA
ncbi:Uncharacterised protein [Salmonella enterica subsp. enterica]|uniref:Uncharacterized protein n=1 Tax=Salmonella enterica I TaxID=59201 RepID=A0A379WD25_SALET|nr:Uncharacterised protein [Salmonella enterica subsp. enterica]